MNREEGEAAVRAAYEFLEERGQATKAEIVREVMPSHPLGYDVEAALDKLDGDKRYRGAWWRRVISPALETFDDIEKPTGGRSEWRCTGEAGAGIYDPTEEFEQ